MELKTGEEVLVTDGRRILGTAYVRSLLGEGGQGWVYKATYDGRMYALKWLKGPLHPQEFRRNLENNIRDGAPGRRGTFLWPLYMVTSRRNPSFGYLMELRPTDYVEFDDIYNGYELKHQGGRLVRVPCTLSSIRTMIAAAANIVESFRELHLAGKSYQDLNGGGFYIHPKTGDLKIGDCDNVAMDGLNLGIKGFQGFEAPEVVRNEAYPGIDTDRYSLAVVLFRLFFRADPLEGARLLKRPLQDDIDYIRAYGREPVFIFDPDNDSNRPVQEIHTNAVRMWGRYPEFFREAFVQSFTEGLMHPARRLRETQWMDVLTRLYRYFYPRN